MLKLSCDRAEQINTFLLHKHCSMTPAPASHLFLVLPLPELPEDPLPATLYGSSSLLPAPAPR